MDFAASLPPTAYCLIVDDFDSMRRITAKQLHHLGIDRVLEAADGAQALELLARHPVAIIFSDLNMPVVSGLDLLSQVRSNPKWFRLPFVMITAETERAKVLQAIDKGVSELLVKPYTAGRFADSLQRALRWKPRQGATPEQPATQAPSISTSPDNPMLSQARPVAVSQAKGKPTILIVDDAVDNLTLLSHLFLDEYKVQVAQSGAKAISMCQSDTPPDLILLDIMMPEMDGFEVANNLRSHPSSENIPIIFVTAMTDDAARLRGMQLGAVDFVTKPVDPDGLRLRVTNFMRYIELKRGVQADYDALLASAQLKDDVERITRHDMKNPLAAVIGLLQDVIDHGNLDEADRQSLKLAEEATLQAMTLINLSSELYKIETGKFTLAAKPVNLLRVLRKCASLLDKVFASKQLQFTFVTPHGIDETRPQCVGDDMFCYSIFENLLKNACEASNPQSTIVISLFNEDPVRVTIQNDGVVPMEVRETFFDKYATFGKPDGTGIGTYSAKLLLEAQNGTIGMTTDTEAGKTQVTATLPVLPVAQSTADTT